MKSQELLTKIGLTEKEAAIYRSLVGSGPTTVAGISKNSRLHRPVVYRMLPDLIEKGLVSVSLKGRLKYYVAESPEKLSFLLEQTSKQLKESLIPELKGVFSSASHKPIVKILEGKKGIRFVFEDALASLKRGDTYYRYSSLDECAYDIRKYIPENFQEDQDRKSIGRFVIMSERQKKYLRPSLNREEKVLVDKYELFDDNITQLVYANKVAFIDYNTETALIIENSALAGFQRKLFKLLYGKLL